MIKLKKYYPLSIIILIGLVFGNTLFNQYNLDDELVTRNHPLTSPEKNQSLSKLFQSNYEQSETINHGYRPIALLSFYLEHKLFGESPFVSHLINLILYALLSLLLYHLLLLIFMNIKREYLLVIVLLFACLPIHTEVVASIKNRDEILSFLFLSMGLISSINWIKKGNFLFLLLTAFALCLSLLSKKSSVPIILLTPIILVFYSTIEISVKKAIGLFFSFSFPFSLLVINYSLSLGVYLSIACFLLFSASYLSHKKLSNYLDSYRFVEVLGLFISLFLILFSLFHQDQTFYLIALACLGILIRRHQLLFIIISSVFSCIGFLMFYESYFIFYSIFLLSGGIYALKDERHVNKALIVLLFLTILIATLKKEEVTYSIVLLIPSFVLLSERIHKYLPVAISLITLIVSGLFFSVSILVIGLNALTIVSLVIKLKTQRIKAISLTMLLVLFSVSLSSSFEESPTFFKTLSKQASEKVEENLIGRELSYIENPLITEHSSIRRLNAGFHTIGKYLSLSAVPYQLSFYYGYSKISPSDFTLVISILVFVLLSLALFYAFNKRQENPMLLFGLFWFLLAILPFSNWFFLIAGVVGERLSFVASFGFCIFIGGLFYQLDSVKLINKRVSISLSIAALLIVVFSARSIARNQQWENHLTLMKADIKHLENSAQANYLLAINGLKSLTTSSNSNETSQKLALAEKHLKKSIEIYDGLDTYHQELGKVYLAKNELEKAESCFKKAIQLEPNSIVANQELIKISFSLKKHEQVIKYGEYYLKRDPNQSLIFEMVAFSAFYLDDTQKTIKYAKIGLQYFPNNKNLKELVYRLNG